jgi:hypothetical protein
MRGSFLGWFVGLVVPVKEIFAFLSFLGCCSLCTKYVLSPLPEFIDPVLAVKIIVFAKLSPKCSFSFQSVPRDTGLRLFWMRSDWGVSFQILELRRGRDQQVFLFKERPY